MAEMRKIKINGNEYEFINSYRNTRSGFAHDTELFKNGVFIGRAKAIYYNHTWERYRYQSVMYRCVDDIITEKYNNFIANYKAQNNISRLTAEKREKADKEFYSLAEIKELKKVFKQLEKSC